MIKLRDVPCTWVSEEGLEAIRRRTTLDWAEHSHGAGQWRDPTRCKGLSRVTAEDQPGGERQGREHSQESLGDPEERSRRLCSAGDEEGGFESRLDRTCRDKHRVLGLRNWKDRVAIS